MPFERALVGERPGAIRERAGKGFFGATDAQGALAVAASCERLMTAGRQAWRGGRVWHAALWRTGYRLCPDGSGRNIPWPVYKHHPEFCALEVMRPEMFVQGTDAETGKGLPAVGVWADKRPAAVMSLYMQLEMFLAPEALAAAGSQTRVGSLATVDTHV